MLNNRDGYGSLFAVLQLSSICLGVSVSLILALLGCAFWDKLISRKPHERAPSRINSSRDGFNLQQTQQQQRLSVENHLELTSITPIKSMGRSASKHPKQTLSSPDVTSSSPQVTSASNDSFAIYSELDSTYSRLDDVSVKRDNEARDAVRGSGPMLPPRGSVIEFVNTSTNRISGVDSSSSPGCSNRDRFEEGNSSNDTRNPIDPGYSAIRIPPPRDSQMSTTRNDSNYSTIPCDISSSLDNVAGGSDNQKQQNDKPEYAAVNKVKSSTDETPVEEDFSHLYSPIIRPNNRTSVPATTSDSQTSASRAVSGCDDDKGYSTVADIGSTASNGAGSSGVEIGGAQGPLAAQIAASNIYEELKIAD